MDAPLNMAQWKLEKVETHEIDYYTTIGRDATSPLSSKMSRMYPIRSTKGLSLSSCSSGNIKKNSKRFAKPCCRFGSHACPQQADCSARLLYARVEEGAADERGPALGHMRKSRFSCRPLCNTTWFFLWDFYPGLFPVVLHSVFYNKEKDFGWRFRPACGHPRGGAPHHRIASPASLAPTWREAVGVGEHCRVVYLAISTPPVAPRAFLISP